MRLRTALALVLLLGLSVPAAAAGARAGDPLTCTATSPTCSGSLTVPLDPSGAVPGEVKLAVEEYVPDGVPRGTILFVDGGPGASSLRYFDALETDLALIFPG